MSDKAIVKPITPMDIASAKAKTFPPEIINIWNMLIAKKFTNGRAKIYQEDAIQAILDEYDTTGHSYIDRAAIFDKGYLNIEEIYREAGWEVTYDKPAYDESYAASFEFVKP